MNCGSANNQDFCVSAGATFHPTIRWGTDQMTAVPVQAIAQVAPALITAPGHNVPNGWPVAVVSAQGMTQINATRYPPQGPDWKKSTVVSASQVALNSVNAADFSTYTSGGFLVFSTPVALAGVTATMTIWDNPERTGTPLATLTSTGGGGGGSGTIAIDTTLMTLTPTLQTAALTWQLGYYTLDVTDATGTVTELMRGAISLD
jgi:hypothetical protein